MAVIINETNEDEPQVTINFEGGTFRAHIPPGCPMRTNLLPLDRYSVPFGSLRFNGGLILFINDEDACDELIEHAKAIKKHLARKGAAESAAPREVA